MNDKLAFHSLNDESIYIHVFERYMELEAYIDELDQNLGIVARDTTTVQLEISRDNINDFYDNYSLQVRQSLTSLNSSKDNNNSTTGYVLWNSTPFFIKWLLYDDDAEVLRNGGEANLLESENCVSLKIDPLFTGDKNTCIIELGSGVSGVMATILANYVRKYVVTDQKGIIKKLTENLLNNKEQVRRRRIISQSNSALNTFRKTELLCNLEILALDWEIFCNPKITIDNVLLPEEGCNSVYITAFDVIYNEYLITPFVATLSKLLHWYVNMKDIKAAALIVVQLRTQDVLQCFLETVTIKYELKCHHLVNSQLQKSRFAVYYITL
ncbi:HBR087Wp [Eremothecium sinecaudum]|uniref:Ribosomal lysine N-methyltransferase 5 n=1 Tax=Eremothecium sinecaudum TaxID=45286 RepID=A0A109UWS5_9SACH|nr:HBR087Wp [Eremothecium sinecaudum]AMD18988.1 HBR087Wp [Eremothecium sinecaudum]